MENALNVMVFFAVAALIFYFFSKILDVFKLAKSKIDSIGSVVLLCLIAIVFLFIFKPKNFYVPDPWERSQRR
jgi:hypothetical protein